MKMSTEIVWPRFLSTGCLSLILAIPLFLSACSNGYTKSSQKSNQPAVPVKVATAVQKDVPVQLRAIGNVEAYSTVEVKPQIDGELARVYFEEGDEVKKGELLFLIDTRPFEAALRQAEANLARDIAQLKKAKEDARRYTDLFKKGIVSEQEYDQYRTNFEALEATVKADRAVLENAKLELEYCYIRSPINGRIGEILVHEGNTVKGRDTTLAIINQTKPIYVSFSVPEQYLSEIRKYMSTMGKLKVEAYVPERESKPKVISKKESESNTSVSSKESNTETITFKNEPNPIVGELSFINNKVDEATGTIMLKGVFQNEDETLWPGRFANVALTLTTQPNAVVVPSQAIQIGQEGHYLFVVKPDLTVESRPVVLGIRPNQKEVVIVNGLQPGEKVVTEGQLQLAPGVKVEIKESEASETQNSYGLDKKMGSNY
jgi:multidrug efflux system membrane fusion protein